MPIISSNYRKKPWYLFNAHFETVVPSLFFKVDGVAFERERLELDDGDFLDLDWVKTGSNRLIILSHGLEGSSYRHYIKRPAKFFAQKGWDLLAWNNRSCSGEMNRLPRFYHHGATEDIAAVIDRALEGAYDQIVLMGYSMGGGMQQKYLGERTVDPRIVGAVSFSVPCNLLDSVHKLQEKGNQFYEKRFVKKLKEKILAKASSMAMGIDVEPIKEVENFHQLDTAFTLQIHPEFKDAEDFYTRISSDHFLANISIPLLVVNAQNDPMLKDRCFPTAIAEQKANIYLEMPEKGGHVGFTQAGEAFSYMEYAAETFIENVILPSCENQAIHR